MFYQQQQNSKTFERNLMIICFLRTRCATEDEEEVISNEIQQLFPNHVEDDFGEFIQADTLEQVTRNKPSAANAKKQFEIMADDDIKLVCDTFITILQNYARYAIPYSIVR